MKIWFALLNETCLKLELLDVDKDLEELDKEEEEVEVEESDEEEFRDCFDFFGWDFFLSNEVKCKYCVINLSALYFNSLLFILLLNEEDFFLSSFLFFSSLL